MLYLHRNFLNKKMDHVVLYNHVSTSNFHPSIHPSFASNLGLWSMGSSLSRVHLDGHQGIPKLARISSVCLVLSSGDIPVRHFQNFSLPAPHPISKQDLDSLQRKLFHASRIDDLILLAKARGHR